ncbi:hypothetical protein [Kiloniella sp.]|uniref:hypothetical protein n=1 Tax=Kiloniella sp. TaxID=1938587 RepID=UPI003A91DDEC
MQQTHNAIATKMTHYNQREKRQKITISLPVETIKSRRAHIKTGEAFAPPVGKTS